MVRGMSTEPIMAGSANRSSVIAWVRDVALVVAVVGAAWALSGRLGQIEAKVEHNADLIQRNAEAIERNAQAIAKLQESMALLNGRFAEHVRRDDQLASR